MIKLKISDLKNPFAYQFDLSKCGDAGKSLAIMTGFRKEQMEEHNDKIEVWISPRFLIEKFRESSAKHFNPILKKWDETIAPIGLFYAWGGWDILSWYDYLTTETPADLSSINLYRNWLQASKMPPPNFYTLPSQQFISPHVKEIIARFFWKFQ